MAEEALTISQRIARIEAECASPLGFAQRGVASWEQTWLLKHHGARAFSREQMAKLMEIETQVFGEALYQRDWANG